MTLSAIFRPLDRIPSWIWAGMSFLAPFLYCLFFGRIGFNPLDSPIVFDGAYRILEGQDYLIDYYAPAGYVPSQIQAFFFRIMGVNWFSFAFHAALFNGFFGLLVFQVFRQFKTPPYFAALYAAGSGLVFYASFGTPYPDQHAFFFSLLGLFLLIRGANASGRKAQISWLLTGPVFILGFLSKPVPTAYAMILAVLLLPLFLNRDNWKQGLLYMAMGSIGMVLLTALWLECWRMDLHQAWHYFWTLPREVGMERLSESSVIPGGPLKRLFAGPFQAFASYNDPNVIFAYGLPVLLLGLAIAKRLFKVPWLSPFLLPQRSHWQMIALGTGVTLVSSLFIRVTANQLENGIPFVFLHLGLIHWFLLDYFRDKAFSSGHSSWVFAWPPFLIFCLLWFFIGLQSITFHYEVIAARKVHDFPPTQEIPYIGPSGLSGMDWLLWQEPWRYGDRNMEELIAHLRENDQPFLYFGDMTFLYGLMRQENPIPALWLHPGLTVPSPADPLLSSFDDQFLANLQALGPRLFIVENEKTETYKGITLDYFPKVSEWVNKRMGTRSSLGTYVIWELNP